MRNYTFDSLTSIFEIVTPDRMQRRARIPIASLQISAPVTVMVFVVSHRCQRFAQRHTPLWTPSGGIGSSP